MIFPAGTHPDLQQPGSVHHGWNIGRQLLLHTAGSLLTNRLGQDEHARRRAIAELRRPHSHPDEVTGPLTLALHICAVQQPPPNVDPILLTRLISEALFASSGAGLLEVGVPAVNPWLEGPVIGTAHEIALRSGDGVATAVATVRLTTVEAAQPVYCMAYWRTVHNFGPGCRDRPGTSTAVQRGQEVAGQSVLIRDGLTSW
ncbi:tryptophan synthase subunit alpha [Streptomyces flaveolus]|uniref:tryptophan synthase subunit alpha n=1 Tax=Streptomyces flaveolus TaxID=67297 RepID=UPI00331CDC5B